MVIASILLVYRQSEVPSSVSLVKTSRPTPKHLNPRTLCISPRREAYRPHRISDGTSLCSIQFLISEAKQTNPQLHFLQFNSSQFYSLVGM